MRGSKKKFVDFKTAKEFATSLELINAKDWFLINREDLPIEIPKFPHMFYKKEWVDYPHFLNSKNNRKKYKYLSFIEAKKEIQKFKLKNREDFFKFTKSEIFPKNIPKYPNTFYKNKGWTNYPDFLGAECKYIKQKFKPYLVARTFARSLHLHSLTEWKSYCKTGKKPSDIPANPFLIYAQNWKGWSDFLGTGRRRFTRKNDWIDYNELKVLVRELKIKSIPQYRKAIKKGKLPENVPVNPQVVYA